MYIFYFMIKWTTAVDSIVSLKSTTIYSPIRSTEQSIESFNQQGVLSIKNPGRGLTVGLQEACLSTCLCEPCLRDVMILILPLGESWKGLCGEGLFSITCYVCAFHSKLGCFDFTDFAPINRAVRQINPIQQTKDTQVNNSSNIHWTGRTWDE